MNVRTRFSKLEIVRTAIPNSTKKCGSLISIGSLKKKCPKFYLSKHFYSTLHKYVLYNIAAHFSSIAKVINL